MQNKTVIYVVVAVAFLCICTGTLGAAGAAVYWAQSQAELVAEEAFTEFAPVLSDEQSEAIPENIAIDEAIEPATESDAVVESAAEEDEVASEIEAALEEAAEAGIDDMPLEVMTYGLEMGTTAEAMGDGLLNLGLLLIEPELGDEQWRTEVDTYGAAVQQAHQALTEMSVPAEMTDIHNALITATADCDAAVGHIGTGLDSNSEADLLTATDLLNQCAEKMAEPGAMMEAYAAQFDTFGSIEDDSFGESGLTFNEDAIQLEVINQSSYVDDYGSMYIIGEVRNASDQAVQYVEIVADLYDGSDALLESTYSYAFRDIIPAGESSPFNIYFTDEIDFDRVDIVAQGDPTNDVPFIGLDLVHHTQYDEDEFVYVIGQMQNNSTEAVEFAEVMATFYNESGEIVNTGYTFSEHDIILPGEISPFSIFIDKVDGIASYDLMLQGDSTDAQPRTDLVVLTYTDTIDDFDFFSITGEIQNQGDTPAEFVQIIATYYDAEGNIAGTDFGFTDLDVLNPGETSTFEVFTTNREVYASYELYVQGD